MRCLSLILILITLTTAANAANEVIIVQGDVLRGHFVEERHLEGFKAPMRSEGQFVVAPARGLIWDVQKPFPNKTVITPNGLAQSMQGKEVTQLSAQKIPFLVHLYDMLTGSLAGNYQALEDDFSISTTEIPNGRRTILTPRQMNMAGMPYSSITIISHRFVEKVILTKPNGDNDVMTFTDQSLSQNVPTTDEDAAFKSVQP